MASAYFVFEQSTPKGELKEFVFQLTDANLISEARAILANPHSTKVHVQGKVITKSATYNPNWSFHLDPASIGFFEMQMEVCDANVSYVEDHLDEVGGAFLPRNFWCPWSSRLIRELVR
jgi:hypothetical protein